MLYSSSDVLIVGAGAAGLAAASELARHGTEAARKLLRAARRAPLDTIPRRTGR